MIWQECAKPNKIPSRDGKHKREKPFDAESVPNGFESKAGGGRLACDLAGCQFKDTRVNRRFRKLVAKSNYRTGLFQGSPANSVQL